MATPEALRKGEEEEEEAAPPLSLAHPVHSDRTRTQIVASYWALVLLALPVWYWMTSIERLPLPSGRIGLLGQEVDFPIKLTVDLGDIYAPELGKSYGGKVLRELEQLKMMSSGEFPPLEFQVSVAQEPGVGDPCFDVTGDLEEAEGEGEYAVHFRTGAGVRMYTTCGRQLVVGARETPQTIFSVAETLRDLVAPYSNILLHPPAAESRIAQYSPTYRLAFTLLNEDASVGGAATGWEVERALAQYILPTLDQLGRLHNFTIESQVQYFGGLTFDPLPTSSDEPGQKKWTLSEEQMSVFVNSAEWTLTSGVSNDPVLHFILFIPSAERRPLVTQTTIAGQRNDSFILPQWGGVVIHNPPASSGDAVPNMFLTAQDLAGAFLVFRAQLSALLGVPRLPPQVLALHRPSQPITPWQLDALIRRRIGENVKNSASTLKSIVNLVQQIENMPVGQDVLGQVDGALSALDATAASPSSPSSPSQPATLSETLAHSIRAVTLSSQAFFNPGMIGLLYYPTEHKYAVYTPLFAPVAVPLVVALIREVRATRERRRNVGKEKEKAE